MSDAPGREHAPNIKATGITECLTERTQGNAAKNDPTGSSNARRYWQSQPVTAANTLATNTWRPTPGDQNSATCSARRREFGCVANHTRIIRHSRAQYQ